MDKKELIERFHSVHNEAISSKDVEDMHIASTMFIKTFEELTECNVREAQEIVECYEGTLKYYNFLTSSETEEILMKMTNQDGSKGAKWQDSETFFAKVTEMGGKLECEPHYNKWALLVTMNKFLAGQNSVILKWVGDNKDKYFEACYELAITQLKDKDRPYWVRWYFGVGDKL